MTLGMSDDEARKAVQRCELETGLPTTDVVRMGPAKLLDAVLQASKDLTHKPQPAYTLKR
jgi:uncharacterized NAD-dependent epimerase/dehydratase family protein